MLISHSMTKLSLRVYFLLVLYLWILTVLLSAILAEGLNMISLGIIVLLSIVLLHIGVSSLTSVCSGEYSELEENEETTNNKWKKAATLVFEVLVTHYTLVVFAHVNRWLVRETCSDAVIICILFFIVVSFVIIFFQRLQLLLRKKESSIDEAKPNETISPSRRGSLGPV